MQTPETSSTIDIAKLRAAIDLVFDHIENDLKITQVNIPINKELYWDMNIDVKFSVPKEPPEANIGSIKDDLYFLESMLNKARGSIDAPSLMFMHVSPVLLLLCDIIRG